MLLLPLFLVSMSVSLHPATCAESVVSMRFTLRFDQVDISTVTQGLLDNALRVLEHTEDFSAIWVEECERVQAEISAGKGGAVTRVLNRELGFSAVTTDAAITRMTLNTLAGAFRVLNVMRHTSGPCYRYHDRTESWFELSTFHAPPRRDLRPLCARLRDLEPEHDGAQWCADAPNEPIPELYFGVPQQQAYGAITRELRPSRLVPKVVEHHFTEFFAQPTR